MKPIKTFLIIGALLTPITASANNLPTPEEVQGIINACAMGRSVEVTGELNLSFEKLFSGKIEGEGKISDLGGIISSIKDDKLKLEAFKIYNDCITPKLSKQATIKKQKPNENATGVIISGNNNNIGSINIGDKDVKIKSITGDVNL